MALAQQKKGGPYNKAEQRKRREKVRELHFDYSYSERKIADILNVNRATISRDIMEMYAEIEKNWKHNDPTVFVVREIERLEILNNRVRKERETAKTLKEKMTIDRFCYDITNKILSYKIRILEARKYGIKLGIEVVNDEFRKRKQNKRLVLKDDVYEVSDEAYEKIMKIYNEDKKH